MQGGALFDRDGGVGQFDAGEPESNREIDGNLIGSGKHGTFFTVFEAGFRSLWEVMVSVPW